MEFDPPLTPGRLLRRYKRFLADVDLAGETVTVHCPNTGSMLGCDLPDSRVWLSWHTAAHRQYPWTWELVQPPGGPIIGIHTGRTNGIIAEGIASGWIPALQGYRSVRREIRYGHERSRIDLLLEDRADPADARPCYVEIKNVTAAVERGIAFFPDAVSKRGSKHLRELIRLHHAGHRAVLCFCIQRDDTRELRPADTIDPTYGAALREAIAAGVEVMAYDCRVSPHAIALDRSIPVVCP